MLHDLFRTSVQAAQHILRSPMKAISALQESVVQEVGQLNWGAFKPKLAEATIAHLEPIQKTYNEVMEDAAVLDKVRLLQTTKIRLSRRLLLLQVVQDTWAALPTILSGRRCWLMVQILQTRLQIIPWRIVGRLWGSRLASELWKMTACPYA